MQGGRLQAEASGAKRVSSLNPDTPLPRQIISGRQGCTAFAVRRPERQRDWPTLQNRVPGSIQGVSSPTLRSTSRCTNKARSATAR